MGPKFKVGDEVQSVSDPNNIGAVVEICDYHGVLRYRVRLAVFQLVM